jgi:transposase
MILAAVIDNDGRPICSEIMPGNTADVRVLLPIVDRLRSRFGIGRVCVVADRGMISAATIKALEERQLDYILTERRQMQVMWGRPALRYGSHIRFIRNVDRSLSLSFTIITGVRTEWSMPMRTASSGQSLRI